MYNFTRPSTKSTFNKFFFSLCVSDTLSLIYCIKWCKQIMQTLWQNGWICLIIWYIHVIQTLKDDGRYYRKCPVV